MIYRIFIGCIVLACAYFAFDSVRVSWVKFSVSSASENQIISSENANLTVVEFMDYNCTPCRELHPILMRAIERDGGIRYILRPVISEYSAAGAASTKLAYAAEKQGKFFEAHALLIENFTPIDELFIESFARQLDLDLTKLRQDFEDPRIEKLAKENANSLGALKTETIPALLIDGEILFTITSAATPSSDDLLALFNQARALQ